jgi:hypothetical protein
MATLGPGRLLAAALLLPVAIQGCVSGAHGFADGWATADWSSTGRLPPAASVPEPVVQVWSARTGRLKGIVATHSWLVLKDENAKVWRRYDVLGWGTPVREDHRAPDARWYGNDPEIVGELRGPAAARALPVIEAAIAAYPYRAPGSYRVWPGPNSNTFVQAAIAGVPELAGSLPPTAIGKDYRPDGSLAGLTPSGTGVQLSAWGALGLTVAWVEGFELNVAGLVIGLDLRRPALKLPGIGRVGFDSV